jgi:putative colanic acid biosynthesis UDP-glucose lipid carrier transferase
MSVVERGFSLLGSTIAEAPPRHQPARKWPISYRAIEPTAIACDVAAIFLASTLSGMIYQFATTQTVGDDLQYIGSAAVVSALFLSLTIARNLYDPVELLQVKGQVYTVAVTWTCVFLFCAGVVFALKIGADFSRGAVILFASGGLAALVVQRIFWYLLLTRGLASERFSGRDIILISEEKAVPKFIATLAKHGFELKRQFILRAEQSSAHHSEATSQIISYLQESPSIEEVLISGEIGKCSDLIKSLSRLRELPITISFIPGAMDAKILQRPSRPMGDTICIELQRKPLNSIEISVKRILDIVGASIGLIFLLPLLMITAIAVKLDSPGPILFRQRRRGFNGREFSILKFRTMSVLEDGNLVCQATRNDCRVTRVGRWLRRTSVDELPQLWNVLAGNMSLVGPRPHAVAHDNEFDKMVRHYAVRHHVKPGLTGWAQVHGCRGPTPTAADVERRVEFDLWYIENWSFRLDCLIILRTAIAVARGHNAY